MSERVTGGVDTHRVEAAIREILYAIGEDPDREGLRDTPQRVARAYEEIFSGNFIDPASVLDTVFDEAHRELVLVRDIPVYSMCEHHLLPFYGVAHVGYIPSEQGHVTGLSKLARLVDGFARKPQVQERLTSYIADALRDRLGASSVLVVMECEHMCMTMRGVRVPGSRTITSAMRGGFRTDAASRAEALALIKRSA